MCVLHTLIKKYYATLQRLTSYVTHGAHYGRSATHILFFLAHKRTQIKCIYRTRGPDAHISAAL